ncbi:MAG: DUF4325 domain-containing protein [bacterium]|nr:DUF4325 domain-containing protein [bacterium]
MRIEIKKFGELLLSPSDGQRAFLTMQSDLLKNIPSDELIELDFSGVKALAPSWAKEVLFEIAEKFKNVKLLNTENETVQATLKTLREYSDLKI